MNETELRISTIGHSNRTLEELIALLTDAKIVCLVDVRRYPVSKRHPHFDTHNLRRACDQAQINYHWAGEHLGGYRPALAGSPHTALSDGLRGFADYMASEAFVQSISRLIDLAKTSPTAILCAEKHPQDCHRLLISDYLWTSGVVVEHLTEKGRCDGHRLSHCARLTQGKLIYDRLTQQSLALDL